MRQIHVLQKNQMLFMQGHACNSIYILRSGSAKSSVLTAHGEEQIIAFNRPGDFLGLDGMNTGTHTHGVTCLDTSSVIAIPRAHFFTEFMNDDSASNGFLKQMSEFYNAYANHMIRLGKLNAEQKIASFILDMWQAGENSASRNMSFDFFMSRGDIANYLGLALETVSRLFTRFQNLGLIEVKRRRVFVYEERQLEAIVGGYLDLASIQGGEKGDRADFLLNLR